MKPYDALKSVAGDDQPSWHIDSLKDELVESVLKWDAATSCCRGAECSQCPACTEHTNMRYLIERLKYALQPDPIDLLRQAHEYMVERIGSGYRDSLRIPIQNTIRQQDNQNGAGSNDANAN